MTKPLTTEQLRDRISDYVQAAYLHGLSTENLDTCELEPPLDISDTDWITDALMSAVKDHVDYVIGEDLEVGRPHKIKQQDGSIIETTVKRDDYKARQAVNAEKAEQRNRGGGY